MLLSTTSRLVWRDNVFGLYNQNQQTMKKKRKFTILINIIFFFTVIYLVLFSDGPFGKRKLYAAGGESLVKKTEVLRPRTVKMRSTHLGVATATAYKPRVSRSVYIKTKAQTKPTEFSSFDLFNGLKTLKLVLKNQFLDSTVGSQARQEIREQIELTCDKGSGQIDHVKAILLKRGVEQINNFNPSHGVSFNELIHEYQALSRKYPYYLPSKAELVKELTPMFEYFPSLEYFLTCPDKIPVERANEWNRLVAMPPELYCLNTAKQPGKTSRRFGVISQAHILPRKLRNDKQLWVKTPPHLQIEARLIHSPNNKVLTFKVVEFYLDSLLDYQSGTLTDKNLISNQTGRPHSHAYDTMLRACCSTGIILPEIASADHNYIIDKYKGRKIFTGTPKIKTTPVALIIELPKNPLA